MYLRAARSPASPVGAAPAEVQERHVSACELLFTKMKNTVSEHVLNLIPFI